MSASGTNQPLAMRFSFLLTIVLTFSFLMAGCSQPSGEMGEVELPNSFDRPGYLAKHFEHLEKYCDLLEHLYTQPDSDSHVIAEIEKLVSSKIVLARATSLSPSDLDRESVTALLSVLDLAENDRFGDESGLSLVLDPSVEYLRSIQAGLEARREHLGLQIEY